jgi:6-phosphogluconolactonase (cycloisomerase 2 family)
MTPQNSSVNEIMGYAAAANGSLTPLPGSPWTADVTSMAVNGKYLFAANRNGVYVDAYHINQSNGSLALWSQSDVAAMNSQDCGYSGQLVLDHTGATLYDLDYNDDGCANNDYRSLKINSSVGSLSKLGATQGNTWLTSTPTILANNVYAYAASCLGNMYWGVWGYRRQTNGDLTDLANFTRTLPTAKSGDFWCPSNPAADPSGHVAIVMQPVVGDSFASDGGAQIASFTVDANGNLTTTNTAAQMPVGSFGSALTSSMSPDGKLFAVGGSSGLQVFHFNAASVPTHYTNLLVNVEIDQMFWDKQNHLYAISRPANKLYVFTVTTTSAGQAPGSPHAITAPQNVIVQPLPLYQ